MTDNNNGNGADQFDRLAVIQEIEQLKQQVARYETEVKPLADRELQRIKDEAVKQYELTEAEAQIMAERLEELTNEQAINETALQIAGEFRVTDKPRYTDAYVAEHKAYQDIFEGWQTRNPLKGYQGAPRNSRDTWQQVNTPYEHGKQAYAKVNKKYSKQLGDIGVPIKPLGRHVDAQPSTPPSLVELQRRNVVLRWYDKLKITGITK